MLHHPLALHTLGDVAPDGDVVEIQLTVSNVGDGLYPSSIIVSGLLPSNLSISALELKDIDGEELEYLSASPHDFFGGNTRVHGEITIRGSRE